LVLLGNLGFDLTGLAQSQRIRQVFLDRHGSRFGICCQIHDGKTAQAQLLLDPVLLELKAGW